jgi:hypothetical protein
VAARVHENALRRVNAMPISVAPEANSMGFSFRQAASRPLLPRARRRRADLVVDGGIALGCQDRFMPQQSLDPLIASSPPS